MQRFATAGLTTLKKDICVQSGDEEAISLCDTSSDVFGLRPYLLEWEAPRIYQRGITIFQQGSPTDRLYYIEQGLVKLMIAESSGRQIMVGLRRKNWFLGTAAVILKLRYLATAVTLTQCTLRSADSTWFLRQLQNDAGLSLQLNRMLCQEIRHNVGRLLTVGCLDARKRLRNLLCELLKEECLSEERMSREIDIPLKNHEISEITGVTPEHVCRLLRQMECDGLVKRIGRRLTIVSPIDFLCGTDTTD